MQVRGDLLGLVSCNEVATRRLAQMLEEFGLKELDTLGEYIVSTSRASMRAAVRKLPQGSWSASMMLDGYEAPVELKAALSVRNGGIHVDYAGSSPASRFGINSPKCYTDAYTSFGVKCIVAPGIPNNAGSLEVVSVSAPEDSIVHPLRPRAVTARHVIGQMLPELVFDCFEEPLAGKVPAEGAGSMWVLGPLGRPQVEGARADATRFNVISIGIGGMGARPSQGRPSPPAFPSGVGAIPVEITEAQSPLLFRRREFAEGSAGAAGSAAAGRADRDREHRAAPFSIACATFDRRHNPARGRAGGADGRSGASRWRAARCCPARKPTSCPRATA
jgi:N-methylhydantoinase B